ncbi:MAG: hypothetical protein TREMPRED_000391 [Tremellales sp. Tagirdzhanova-0007]|nr:MAG: hypothetical protein TREMPRED_000391 [Tremellales sp. Tagirdzhanova-0007]
MPDARNYVGQYPSPGQGLEGGYGVAAAGAGAGAAAGIGAATLGSEDYASHGDQSHGSSNSPGRGGHPGPSSAAAEKQREAQMERQRLRLSQPYPQASGSGTQTESGQGSPLLEEDERRLSAAPSTVYQHTDMGSVPVGNEGVQAEIPPNYNSLRSDADAL